MLFGPAGSAAYPVRLEADYPDSLSRLSTLFRIVLVLPLIIFVGIITSGGFFATDFAGDRWAEDGAGITIGAFGSLVVAHWIAVFLRRRPVRWLFDVLVAILSFSVRAYTYILLLTDRYPPFEGEWSVRYEVEYPQRLSRWRVAVWKTITVLPHLIVLAFVLIGVVVAVIIAWFAILFTGRYPRGLHSFVSGWLRWYGRAAAYWMSLTDEFPPFSLSAEAGPGSGTAYAVAAAFGLITVAALVAGAGALLAWPADTTEVSVTYQSLLQGEASKEVAVSDVNVTLVAAAEAFDQEGAVFRPKPGERFVSFQVHLKNERDSRVRVEMNDLRLDDSSDDQHGPRYVTLDGLDSPRWLGKGNEVEVYVIFELDEDAQPKVLVYSPSFGFKKQVKFILE